MNNCVHCNGPLESLDFASSHFNRERCFRVLKMRIADLSREARTASKQRDTALRRAEEAEAIASQAMAEGLRELTRAKRLHVYDEDGKVLTQAAVNRLLHERATHAGIIALLRTIVDEAIELQPVCTSPIDLLTLLEHEVHEQRIRRHRVERERDEAEAIANLAMSEGLRAAIGWRHGYETAVAICEKAEAERDEARASRERLSEELWDYARTLGEALGQRDEARAREKRLREALRVARAYMGDWHCKCGREQCDICHVTAALEETGGGNAE